MYTIIAFISIIVYKVSHYICPNYPLNEYHDKRGLFNYEIL